MSMPHANRLPWPRFRLPALGTWAGNGLALLCLWQRRARTRRDLATLTPEQMRDTGLSPAMVRHESAKPFWEA